MGIHDSLELAWQDWLGTAGFDRGGRRRTSGRAAGPRPTSTSPPARSGAWLHAQGVRFFPVVGWAERGGYLADGHGNSVPRFHITWGTGPGVRRAVRAPGARPRRARAGRAPVPAPGRRADRRPTARVDGVRGTVLEPSRRARAASRSSRTAVGEFELHAPGRDRHLRRHRRQPRSGARELARPARRAARAA